MSGVRRPAVAGQFYAGDEAGLRTQIEAAFHHDLGPGEIPDGGGDPEGTVVAVSPHAGYPFSGPIAAHGFAAIAEWGRPDVVVIVGPNHSGVGADIAVTEATHWETPLGSNPVHDGLREQLLGEGSVLVPDEQTHAGEHSLEVQLPFLQFVFGEAMPILPIVMTRQDESRAMDLGEHIAAALAEFDGRAAVVASTDLTHYEPRSVAEQKDRQALDRIGDLDVPGLYRTIEEAQISMCGYGPTATGMTIATGLGATGGSILQYATSGDTGGSPESVVGYGSVVIRA